MIIVFVSKAILIIAAFWLVTVGFYALIWPEKAREKIAKFASTPFIHFGELGLRLIVGMAFVGVSAVIETPRVFLGIGIFLMITAAALMIIPRRLHASYSQYWAEKLTPMMVRVFSPISLIGGAALLFALR